VRAGSVRFAIVCGGGGGVPRAMNAGASGRAAGRAPPAAAAIEQSDAKD